MSATNTVFYPRANSAPTASLAVSTVSVSPVALVGSAENLVFFDVQDADVYCTIDGATAPVSNGASSVGHRLYAGNQYTWLSGNFSKARFIRQGTVDARIQSQECAC